MGHTETDTHSAPIRKESDAEHSPNTAAPAVLKQVNTSSVFHYVSYVA